MTIEPIDERGYSDLLEAVVEGGRIEREQRVVIGKLRQELADLKEQENNLFARANKAVGAIYQMVGVIKDNRVTHAQREGQLLLLLDYIDKKWPSHSARGRFGDDLSDIQF